MVFASRKAVWASVSRTAIPREQQLQRGFGWMCAFGPYVRADGAAFAAWLGEPIMKATVLAAPEQMAHVIGPILNATGAARPEWFPVVQKRRHAGTRGACAGGGDAAVALLPCKYAEPYVANAVIRTMRPRMRKAVRLRDCSARVPRRASARDIPQVALSRRRKIKTDFRGSVTHDHFVTIT